MTTIKIFSSRQLNEFVGRGEAGRVLNSLRKSGVKFRQSSEIHNGKVILTTLINFKDALDFLETYKVATQNAIKRARRRNYNTIKALQEHLCE